MVEYRDIEIIINNPIDWKKFSNKTVLVTGATGRLGMYIVEALSEVNIRWNLNITILALVRSIVKAKNVFGKSLDLPFINLLIQDITQPIEWDSSVDYIFHMAGLASPSDFTRVPVDTLWGHVKGTRNILELAREKRTKKVLYVSTVEIYGNWNSDKLIEETDMGPINCNNARACYPEAKRLCETMLASYKAQYGVDYVGVRMCHTFGPGISLNDGRAFAEFIRDVIEGKDIVLHSDGSAIRTYTYVADAVAAMFLALTKGEKDFYNVANIENQISIRDLATLIAGFDPNRKVQVKYSAEAQNSLAYLPFKLGIMDTRKICDLGWKPKVGIEDAFKWTMEFLLTRRAEYHEHASG